MENIDIVNGVPIKSWCPEIEEKAMNQAVDLAKHPCTFKHVALMPDCHLGFGMPIGGVTALKDSISPAMVGVDIGCGMRAVKTNINRLSTGMLTALKEKIKQRVPTGFSKRSHRASHAFPIDECFETLSEYSSIFSNGYKKEVDKSMGTLGGGKRNDCFQTKRII